MSLSERIRSTWRIHAVDDDLQRAFGEVVLVAGRDLRNIGMELKSVHAGPLDLNSRQFDVLRRTRIDTPPFVFQFTAPPDHPWCFRVWALRWDALECLDGRPCVTLSERDAEAFVMALTGGSRFFDRTIVTGPRFAMTERRNWYPGSCVQCGQRIDKGAGYLLEPERSGRRAVIHPACRGVRPATVEIGFDNGERAYWLASFDSRMAPEDAWPEVTAPRSYAESPLRPVHADAARQYLRLSGALDPAVDAATKPPQLTVVEQRLSATEICERVLRSIRDERPSTSEVARAADRLEHEVTGRILRTPWVDEESLARMAASAERLIGMKAPGPFVGSDGRHNFDDWPGIEVGFWDWTAIRSEEARAKAKASALPRCSACHDPLWLGQPGIHHTCRRRHGGPT